MVTQTTATKPDFLSLRRYEVMCCHARSRALKAIAWTGLAIRLEIDAKSAGLRAPKFLDRAADCRARADRARALAA